MTYIYYIFRSVAVSLISVLQLMMLVRAVMSWFPQTQGGRLHQALRGFPLDLSFLLAYMVLIMLETML